MQFFLNILASLTVFVRGDFYDKWGDWGMALAALLDSSIFPIPIEAALIPSVLLNPGDAWEYVSACVAGSLVGASLGYLIGRVGGEPLLKRWMKEETRLHVHERLSRYGLWGVFLGAATPIPFTIFTWTAGMFHLPFWRFLLVATAGRMLKFVVTATLMVLFGEKLIQTIQRNLDEALIIFEILLIFWIAIELLKRQRMQNREDVDDKK